MHRALTYVAAVALLTACATSPLGRQQLRFFPEGQMAEMGAAAFDQARQETPPTKDSALTRYVTCVADAVTAQVDDGPDEWEVEVFDNPQANAFALPGGKVGVYSGLLNVAKNQHQLATVIGHEIAHVLAQHGNERVSTAYATEAGLQLVQALAGGQGAQNDNLMALLGLGTQVGIILPFSRTQESEADLLGLDLMAKAGFDPRESVKLWQNMAAAGNGAPPEFLSTHPSHGTRTDDLNKRMQRAMDLYNEARRQGRTPNCTR
ncbi:MAG: M48 family metallopeptidase [Thiohalomonadaceae bacterium]